MKVVSKIENTFQCLRMEIGSVWAMQNPLTIRIQYILASNRMCAEQVGENLGNSQEEIWGGVRGLKHPWKPQRGSANYTCFIWGSAGFVPNREGMNFRQACLISVMGKFAWLFWELVVTPKEVLATQAWGREPVLGTP